MINQRDEDGEPHGYWEYRWLNGDLVSRGTYKNSQKDGLWEDYWADGSLCWRGRFKNGKMRGLWYESRYDK